MIIVTIITKFLKKYISNDSRRAAINFLSIAASFNISSRDTKGKKRFSEWSIRIKKEERK